MAGLARCGSFGELVAEEPYPGLVRRTFSSAEATINSYTFDPGATFPLHRHPQEQITLVVEGVVEMTIAHYTTQLEEGAWSVVPGGVEHEITAGPAGAQIIAMIVPRRDSADSYEFAELA